MATITAPIDGRPQYPKLYVELVNAMNGREPTFGVQQQVGDRYILEKWPAPSRASYGGSSAGPVEVPVPEAPRSAAQAIWPNLR
jgi:hypothetical protein